MGELPSLRSSTLKVRPTKKLSGSAILPGDKSLSHRVLLFASLAEGQSVIRNFLDANVTAAMIECLHRLGIVVEKKETDTGIAEIAVHGRGMHGYSEPLSELNCGGSATTMRMFAGLLASRSFHSVLDGNERLRQRPMNRVVDPLIQKGAIIETQNGNAPLTFHPAELKPSEHILQVASAQVKSAILFSGMYCSGKTTVVEPLRSRDHTERLLRNSGVEIDEWTDAGKRHGVTITGPVYSLPVINCALPSDPSSAAFPAVAASILDGSCIEIPNVCLNAGRTGLFDSLQRMGAEVSISEQSTLLGEDVGKLTVKFSELHGISIGAEVVPSMIDEFPIFAVAATQAKGKTVVTGAAELKIKESDRIISLAEELNKMGACIEPLDDGFIIEGPKRLNGAKVNALGDHRLAMTLAIAGLIADGETEIENWAVLNESFPGFPELLKKLGADIEW